jgi:hypothetical protein
MALWAAALERSGGAAYVTHDSHVMLEEEGDDHTVCAIKSHA